ncbi:MAG TPA: FmdB family zinc ribbon protein [Bryobacteraceae bacterium]|jgi:putative FmdB family regulatory protein|nr:FmdB family zinc ribbon protein [Bryobacteraceae bacterium]
MPRYEYKCEGCGEVFELQQKFADEPLTVHEKCGGRVERIISAPALMFKGSGFYVNDYAKGGSNGGSKKSESDSKSDSKPATDTAAKSETKTTESKPAASSSDKAKTD